MANLAIAPLARFVKAGNLAKWAPGQNDDLTKLATCRIGESVGVVNSRMDTLSLLTPCRDGNPSE